jgi:Rod binding domain-containing protein
MSSIQIKQLAGIALEQNRERQFQDKKEDMAMEFERIFARHLVEEMTKGSFKMDDNAYGASSFGIHRTHITDTLANEIAQQRKLGMADMVMKHWNK